MISVIKSIIKNKVGLVQYPSFVTFFVTWRCNCKCVMCNIWKKKEKDGLSLKEIDNIFSQLKPIDAIRISGGEPFLRNDLAEIINIIDRRVSPKIIHITTNGLLTKQIIEQVKKIKTIKNIHLKISIDQVGDKHDKIRGIKGAFDKAVDTLEKLSKMRDKLGFYLGVNQTIVDRKGLNSYFELKSFLKKYDVSVLPVIAYDASTGLYGGDMTKFNPENSYKTFGKFSKKELDVFIKILLKDTKYIKNFEERVIKRYYLKGLHNRLIKSKRKPRPLCVALHSHLRILPNGDVPVCIYNPSVVGNLKNEKFKDVWFGKNIKRWRRWVRFCKGCWAGCESNVNAIYSGDIWKGLF